MLALDIKTPLALVDQSARIIANPAAFTCKPGQMVKIDSTGKVAAVSAATDYALMTRTSVSGNVYEGNDVKAGRITVIESYGVRAVVGSDVIEGSVAGGDSLALDATKPGKLIKTTTAGALVYAKVIAVNGSEIEIKTVQPYKY